MKLLVSHIIRLFLIASFLTCAASVQGQIITVVAVEGEDTIIDIPSGKVLEIVGFMGGEQGQECELFIVPRRETNEATVLNHGDFDDTYKATVLNHRQTFDHPVEVAVKYIAGPQTLIMFPQRSRLQPVLTYKITDNLAPTTSKPVNPKADDIKLTDEFLMLDYTVQANTTYKLGISKDLKNWKPLFEFTPESDKLNVELPKIILGNKSFLKLE
ncbi:hypothetical protein N8683_02370 [bacterium]|nr:hypothetical protein [bacterium]